MDIKTLKTEIATTNLTSKDIDELWDILKDKGRFLRAQEKIVAKATLNVGDSVRIKDIRPKALVGLIGKISSIKGVRANVKLDTKLDSWNSAAKYVNNDEIRGVPLTCLEVR